MGGAELVMDLRRRLPLQLPTRSLLFPFSWSPVAPEAAAAAAAAAACSLSWFSLAASSGDLVIPDMKLRNLSPYSRGGWAEICVLSLCSPFQKCSIFLMIPYCVIAACLLLRGDG